MNTLKSMLSLIFWSLKTDIQADGEGGRTICNPESAKEIPTLIKLILNYIGKAQRKKFSLSREH